MLKKVAAFSVFSVLTMQAWAGPFDGFYGGADVGMSQATFKKSQMVELTVDIGGAPIIDIPIQNNKKLTDSSFLGNIDLGFSKVFKEYFYLGLEGNVDFQNIEAKNSPSIQETNSSFQLPFTTKVKLKNEFALTVNPGIVFNKTTLLYGKIGPAWGRFSVEGDANYSQNFGGLATATADTAFKDNNFYECGLRLGLGVEQAIAEHMTLRLELVNTNYNTIHSSSPTSGAVSATPAGSGVDGALTNSDKIKANNTSVLFGFNYRFG